LTGSDWKPSHPKKRMEANSTLLATGRSMKIRDTFTPSIPYRLGRYFFK
jgi:hypothetical protein